MQETEGLPLNVSNKLSVIFKDSEYKSLFPFSLITGMVNRKYLSKKP